MFRFFKRRKELTEELELTKIRLDRANEMVDEYRDMVIAYRSAIHQLQEDGVIDEEQLKAFFAEADKYQNNLQTT